MSEFLPLLDKISTLSFGSLLAMIIYLNYKRVWVWGSELKEQKEETKTWKAMALNAVGIAETSVNIASNK